MNKIILTNINSLSCFIPSLSDLPSLAKKVLKKNVCKSLRKESVRRFKRCRQEGLYFLVFS